MGGVYLVRKLVDIKEPMSFLHSTWDTSIGIPNSISKECRSAFAPHANGISRKCAFLCGKEWEAFCLNGEKSRAISAVNIKILNNISPCCLQLLRINAPPV